MTSKVVRGIRVIRKHNSIQRLAAGMLVALALGFTATRGAQVAASDGSSLGTANLLASVQVAANQAVAGTMQVAQDLRSLYNVYQLQNAPEVITASATASVAPLLSDEEARLIMCEVFQAPKPAEKKKCRT
jgi:hypothetical protein